MLSDESTSSSPEIVTNQYERVTTHKQCTYLRDAHTCSRFLRDNDRPCSPGRLPLLPSFQYQCHRNGCVALTSSTHHDAAANDAPCNGVEVRTACFPRLLSGRLLLHREICGARSVGMWLSRCTIRTATTQARQRGRRCPPFSLVPGCAVNIVPFIMDTVVNRQH